MQNLASCAPVLRLAQARAHAHVNRVGPARDDEVELLGHRANGTPKCSSTSPVTSVSAHSLLLGRVDAAEQQHALRVVAVQRAVAAAADVVRPAPVDELVAELGRRQHVAGVRALERRPEPVQARPGRCRRPGPATARLAVDAPAAAAAVAVVAARGEAQLAARGCARRPRRSRAWPPGPRPPARAASRPRRRPAPRGGSRRARRPSPSGPPATRPARPRSAPGPTGASTRASANASARLTRASTVVCEWSDMTITACSSRKASTPPATCTIRSSARSASAIERTWPSGPGLVRVGVVVGQREEQEVEQVVLDQVGADAAGVLVALPGHAERRRAAGVARVEQVRVEELAGAVDRVAELRRLGDAAVDAGARGVVAGAAAVDQPGGAGGPQAGVVEVLEDRLVRTREVRHVHVVDRVVERAHHAERARRLERRAVLDVALLAAVVPVHRRDVVLAGAAAGGDRGARHRRHRGERRQAVADVGAAVAQRGQRRRAALLDRQVEHVRLERVDDREDELLRPASGTWTSAVPGARRTSRPRARGPPSSSTTKAAIARIEAGGTKIAIAASSSAAPSA